MEVKLGQLPEACHLTHSYQKHRSLYRFKETRCVHDSLTFRCLVWVQPSTFCHQQLETHNPPASCLPAFFCCQDVMLFHQQKTCVLIIYVSGQEGIIFYLIGDNEKHLVLLLNMNITFIVVLLFCNIPVVFSFVFINCSHVPEQARLMCHIKLESFWNTDWLWVALMATTLILRTNDRLNDQ